MKALKIALLCCAMLFCGMYLIGSAFLVVIAPFLDIEGPWVMMITGAIMALLFGWLFVKAWTAFRSVIGLQSKSSKQNTNKRFVIRDETKYKIKLGASLLTALVGAGMIVSSREDLFEAGIPLIFGGIIFAFGYSRRHKKKVNQEKEARALAQAQANLEANLKRVNSMSVLPVMVPDTVVLRPGEVCHYQAAANVMQIKNEVIGHTSGSAGVSVRVAKGLTLHSGSSRGHAIRQDVSHLYPGLFTITNQRFIMTGEKGFNHPISKLTAITPFNGFEGITLQFGRSLYTILMEEPYWIPKILQLMKECSAAEVCKSAPPTSDLPRCSMEKETHQALSNSQEEDNLTPQNAELSYLDAQALKFWSEKKTDFVIPAYYDNSAFGKNLKPALERLLDGGYLSLGDLRQRISICTVPELRAVLADRELKVSGNKSDLVSRILANFDEDEIEDRFPVNVYRITEKGTQALAVYSILEDNDAHSLNLSYYRLMKEREAHPSEENNVILTRLLSEDVQECYKTKDRSRFLRVIDTTARFMHEIGEDELSFECYALSFFVWTSGEIKTPFPESLNDVIRLTARLIDREGKLCGYDLTKMLDAFRTVVVRTDPFCLASQENVGMTVNLLRESLSIK